MTLRLAVTELNLCLQAQKYIQSLPSMPPQDMEKIFRGANPLGGWRPCSGLEKQTWRYFGKFGL